MEAVNRQWGYVPTDDFCSFVGTDAKRREDYYIIEGRCVFVLIQYGRGERDYYAAPLEDIVHVEYDKDNPYLYGRFYVQQYLKKKEDV